MIKVILIEKHPVTLDPKVEWVKADYWEAQTHGGNLRCFVRGTKDEIDRCIAEFASDTWLAVKYEI